jgi:uncharacterized protein (TIGR03118 family)
MPARYLALAHRFRPGRVLAAIALLAAVQVTAALPVSASERGDGGDEGFVQTNLVSDLSITGVAQDTNLHNPWGIVHGPATPWWVSDNNGNVSTLYNGAGQAVPLPPAGPLVVNIPAPGADTGGTPTGLVFNGMASDFFVTDAATQKTGSSLFIFATEDGTIAGWSPTVKRTQAFIAVDNSKVPDQANGAVYKGLAIDTTSTGLRLYATNFRAGTVDVFDSKFAPVKIRGAFMDRRIPKGFAPFGIQAVGDRIYVTYAKQKPDKHDDLSGRGNGFVDVFNTNGKLLKRLVSRGKLNSPWGLAVAPKGFGDFGGDLLVGNFGDGRINAYNPRSGEFEGTLRDTNEKPIVIDGLWGLGFGNGAAAGPTGTLFFSAGTNGEVDGLFGTLTPAVKSAE